MEIENRNPVVYIFLSKVLIIHDVIGQPELAILSYSRLVDRFRNQAKHLLKLNHAFFNSVKTHVLKALHLLKN